MSGSIQKFDYDDIQVFYDSEKRVLRVLVASVPLDEYVAIFNESNFHVVNSLRIAPEFQIICNKIFATITDLIIKNEMKLAAYLSSYFFERFTVLWNYYLQHDRHILGTKLWQHTCVMTWNWEKTNNVQIHKGTPYFFLGSNQLMQGNMDNAFLLIYNAMEEDKRFSEQMTDPLLYKTMPAYLFSSLIADNPKNFLFPYVQDAKKRLESFISKHNSLLSRSFSYADLDSKFLKNQDLEESKFFFVYTLFIMNNQAIIDTEELRSNDFSKLRNLDIIFNLCLIIDEVMKNKTKQKFVSDSVIQICKNNLVENDALNIFKSMNFENDFENGIKKCLALNYSYGTRSVSKEVIVLILVWALRNFGGHRIEAKQLFVDEYNNLLEKLLSALFIILETIY